MTEEPRHIQLTNQINFVPARCDPSNMIAFMIRNSSLVNNHSTKLFDTHEKVEADEPHGNWRITVVESECKTELTYHVVEYVSSWQEETVSQ